MRILCISQWFEPEPTFKGLVFAKALQAAGHDIEVITGFPNYPDGRIYPNYKIRWLQREVMDGIWVTRVPLYPSHSSSATGRALNYLSFAVTSCLYGVFAARKADVIYAYHPPATVSLSAALIGMICRTPVVVDINDLWPDTLEATGMVRNKRLLRLVGRACLWIYSRAARVVVGTPGYRARLLERGVPPEKIEVIYNWCDESSLRRPHSAIDDAFGMKGRFNVVFAGTMGKAQALEAVIRAAKRVETMDPEVQFVFVGGGIEVENLKRLVQELGADTVRFLPRMPIDEVGKVLIGADVLLVHLKDDPLFEITIPSKTQAYMRVGKPLLMAVKGDAADLVNAAGAGRCALPEDEASLAAVVMEMAALPSPVLEEMGNRGLEFYSRNLSLKIGTEKFLRVFRAVVTAQSGRAERAGGDGCLSHESMPDPTRPEVLE
jgi:colanic acid biosynthesis glycosyl transferase WcaI